ncbi:MAG: glycosyltransferase [Paludibacteraceae bacterium]|nr:glycosyltransferase [Paludibacteraceae bacterium]
MKVLYLSEWYPHRYDAMAGLFVRKHAEAVARRGVDVCVLYLHRDDSVRGREPVEQVTDGVREVYVYYRGSYLLALRAGWRYVRTHWGMPDLCQLNVITKNALLPLYLRRRYGVPYVVVEHWTGYLPENGAYESGARLHRRLAETTVAHASCVMAVSQMLMDNIRRVGLTHPDMRLLNNVVDDFFFRRPEPPRADARLRMLHISCFDEPHKNVCGLLRAVEALCAERKDVVLTLVGVGPDYAAVRSYADTLDLPAEALRWTGELTPEQVAAEFDRADVFVLFSNYETAGVVLSEALATGTPVISTPVGIAPDVINPQTGLMVAPGDEAALVQAMAYMADHYGDYDRDAIRRYGDQFAYRTVGDQLLKCYEQTLRARQ